MPTAANVAAELPRMPPSNQGEAVHQLIAVLAQIFGKPIRGSKRTEVLYANKRKAPGLNRIVGIKNSGNSNRVRNVLAQKIGHGVDDITGVAKFEFINSVGGKSPDVGDSGSQREVGNVAGEGSPPRQAWKRVRTMGVDLAVAEVHGEAIAARGLVIDPHVERILIVLGHRVQEIVVARTIQIR